MRMIFGELDGKRSQRAAATTPNHSRVEKNTAT